MFGDLFGGTFGVVLDPQQQRAMSNAEITAMQMAQANLAQQAEPRTSMAFEDLEKYVYTMAPNGTTERHMIGAVSFVKRDGIWEMPR